MRIDYGLSNLRRLKSTPVISLRPITVLVGRNSAGKSTFLRSLPLLKQSLITKTSAPILWYGDYVDFGDFKSAVSDGDNSAEVKFTFRVSDIEERTRSRTRQYGSYSLSRTSKITISEALVTYSIGSLANKTVLNSITLTVPDEDIVAELIFNQGQFQLASKINGVSLADMLKDFHAVSLSKKIFSTPSFLYTSELNKERRQMLSAPWEIALAFLQSVMIPALPGTIAEKTIDREIAQILSVDRLDHETFLKWSEAATTVGFTKFYRMLADAPNSELGRLIFLGRNFHRTMMILEVLEDVLSGLFSRVTYLGPARARSERYYRRQELEVSDIAPGGENFPMFLASLTRDRLKKFSAYVERTFGYGVGVVNREGHISLTLTVGDKEINVADTGYGVSQLLPVLGQIWWAGEKRPPPNALGLLQGGPSIVAIEQPELHLHPAHQALLADVFVAAVSSRSLEASNPVFLAVETHSEALINRLGELIEEGKISPQDVQIVVFSADDDIHSSTKVEVANFDGEGALINWPFGFFNYS